MASNDRALFLYGFDITNANRYLNFKNAALGSELTAILRIGNYTPTEFMAELKRAMEFVDGIYKYTWSINRTVASGTANRFSVSTNGSYLSILLSSGSNYQNSPRNLIGFDELDYTGQLSYTGFTSGGTILLPDFATYDYLGPDEMVMNDGCKNVSAAGIKETLVFAQMRFFQGQWKYITNFNGNTQKTQFENFLKYATRQLKFEFSPSINEDPDLFYQCTLETTPADGNGLGYTMKQMLGQGLYRFYDTGVLKFRVNPS